MSDGITLEIARKKLDTFLEAEDAVASGQSYTIAGRSWERADLSTISDRITFWDSKVKELIKEAETGSPGIRKRNLVPGDV